MKIDVDADALAQAIQVVDEEFHEALRSAKGRLAPLLKNETAAIEAISEIMFAKIGELREWPYTRNRDWANKMARNLLAKFLR